MGAEKSKLSPSDLKDLTQQTLFSEREIRLWYKSFNRDCPSGRLSFEDFKKLYQKFFPDGDATEFARHAFRTFDVNKDGSIDFREFLCALSVTAQGNVEDKLDWAYSMYDQNNDGQVSKDEMLNIMKAMYKMVGEESISELMNDGLSAEQRVEMMFKKIDVDGDEMISLEEFKNAVMKEPSLLMLLQTNKSGSDNRVNNKN